MENNEMKQMDLITKTGETFSFAVVDQEARDLAQQALDAASASGGSGSGPIQYIESLDESNLANLRDLESGSYVLYGYFRPYAGASSYLPFDNLLVNVFHVAEGSHLFEFSTANSEVNFIEILVDSTVDSGFTYSRTPINMLELHALIEKVGDLSGLTTTEKGNLVAAINEVAANGSDASQNVTLTTAQITALDGMFKVCAYDDSKDVSGAYAAFKTAFGIADTEDDSGNSGGSGEDSGGDSGETEVTLSSISATYSGGDVAVGTALSDLTGIVVTAEYADGSTETVSGYTLNGEIVEGENTVTVSYGGKTTTFTVTGVDDTTDSYISIPVTNSTDYVNRSIYSDDGATLVREDTLSSWCWISDETFDKDTEVKFTFTPVWTNGGRNMSAFVGSTDSLSGHVYFGEGVLGETTGDGWYLDGTHEKTITVKAGHRAILAYTGGFGITATIVAAIVRCTGVSLSADSLTFTEAGSQTLTATVTPEDCTETVTWESSNTNIATVEDGVVTVKNNGSVTITATCGAYYASCTANASGIEVAPLYPFTDVVCAVKDNAGVGVGTITIANGNHVNVTRTYSYALSIPTRNLPESSTVLALGSAYENQDTLFSLKSGASVRTVVTFGDANAHTAGLSVELITAGGTTATTILTSITESGENTFAVTDDLDVGAIVIRLASAATVADFDVEIYVDGARYV